jgi:hypothetical protein
MSPVCRLTADERDRDVPHRRVALSAMPMAFTGLDVHDVTHVDLTLSCSVATMPEPEVTTRIWSQVCVCQPVVHPWLKFTTLQL